MTSIGVGNEGAGAPGGASASAGQAGLNATLVRVGWMAILLGLGIEAALIGIAAASGPIQSLKPFAADLVQKVSWATIVCVGLAVGTAAKRAAMPLASLAGLLSAPIAFNVARMLHKGAAASLGIAAPGAGSVSLTLIALIKGIEYGVLGALVAYAAKRTWGGAAAHSAIGLAIGIVFGGTLLFLSVRAATQPIPPPALIARGINEIIFPVGCAIILFAAQSLGKRLG